MTSNSTQLSKNTSHKHKKNTTKKSPSKKRSNSLEIVDAQSNKLLALYFIKVLCLSATALQSQPKQKARSAIHRFYFFDDFLLSRDLQVDVHLREIDRISAALIVNFVWGHAPNPPVILKEGESPLQNQNSNSFWRHFSLTSARCYIRCLYLFTLAVSFKLIIV